MTRFNPAYYQPLKSPIAGTIRDAANLIGRSRNYIYDLQKRGLLTIHTDARRPRVRTVIFCELLDAVRESARAEAVPSPEHRDQVSQTRNTCPARSTCNANRRARS